MVDSLINAISWTLLHSIWQALILLVVAGVIVSCTETAAPRIRYNLITISFAIFLVSICITFFLCLSSSVAVHQSVSFPSAAGLTTLSSRAQPFAEPVSTGGEILAAVAAFVNTHSVLISLVWLAAFIINGPRLFMSYSRVRNLCCGGVPPSAHWIAKTEELAASIGATPARLLQSARVCIPMVAGIVKPIILLPVTMLTTLEPSQVEAILLHELAHIRRRDQLVNLVQCVAEAVFFFNPFLLWVSALIRDERENCCDDIAIQRAATKRAYIEALVSFENVAPPGSQPLIANGLFGRQRPLLNRVRRIINKKNKKLNAMEKTIFAASIAVIGIAGLALRQPVPSPQKRASVTPTVSASAHDNSSSRRGRREADTLHPVGPFPHLSSVTSSKDGQRTTVINATDSTGKEIKLVLANGKSSQLFVDGKKISEKEMDAYRPLIFDLERSVEFSNADNLRRLGMAQHEQHAQRSQLDAERDELLQRLAELDNKRGEEQTPSTEQLDELRSTNTLNSLLSQDMNDAQRRERLRADFDRKFRDHQAAAQAEGEKAFHELWEQNIRNQERGQHELESLLRLQERNMSGQDARGWTHTDPILEELARQNLITQPIEDLSFELNGKAFIVNGKKQPAEIFQHFKEMFLKNDGDLFRYSRKNGHTSKEVHLE